MSYTKTSISSQNMQNQNMNLALSTDAKPRLKWTPELHQRFVAAINQLGGPDKAKPKSLMRALGIPGLTLYHLKSHLQKYRLGKSQQSPASSEHKQEVLMEEDCLESRKFELQLRKEIENRKQNASNESLQIDQALQIQMEVQRNLHEQIEVQRHLQLRIEAQGKYLQSVLKKALETLTGYNSSPMTGIELAKAELSQLLSMVSNGYPSSPISDLTETGDTSIKNADRNSSRGTGCSVESSLTSVESSGCKDQVTQQTNESAHNSKSIATSPELPLTNLTAREKPLTCGSSNQKKDRNWSRCSISNGTSMELPMTKRMKSYEQPRKSGLLAPFDLNLQYNIDMESGPNAMDLNCMGIENFH